MPDLPLHKLKAEVKDGEQRLRVVLGPEGKYSVWARIRPKKDQSGLTLIDVVLENPPSFQAQQGWRVVGRGFEATVHLVEDRGQRLVCFPA